MIINDEVKRYIISFAREQLKTSPLVMKVFGEDFLNERLKEFERDWNVYTDGKQSTFAGQCCFDNKAIMIYEEGKNGKLSPDEIKSNVFFQEVSLHELVHYIFKGIFEYYEDGTELGRGLDEGLDNFTCEDAGVKTSTYTILTDFVRKLSLVIGGENTIKLQKQRHKK